MASNPLNLTLRFILELVALYALAYWGWTQHQGILRLVLAIGLPLISAVIWGVFKVPEDPGNAPVPIPGILRLLLEITFFTSAVLALALSNRETWALTFCSIVVLHYLFSYDRILWLLRR